VCMGFGINAPEQAAAIANVSDGVVVGSAIVNKVAENAESTALADNIGEFIQPLIHATKNSKHA